jgi:hypothetical protein
MMRYYFDFDDGECAFCDEVGIEATLNEAQAEAVRALPDLAEHQLPNGDRNLSL